MVRTNSTTQQQLMIEEAYSKDALMKAIKDELGYNQEKLLELSRIVVEYINEYGSDFQKVAATEAVDVKDIGYTLIKNMMIQESTPLNKLIIGLGKSHGIKDSRYAGTFGLCVLYTLRDTNIFSLHKYHDDDVIDITQVDDDTAKSPTWNVRREFAIINPKIVMKANMVEFLPPLLCEPKEHTEQEAGGYISTNNIKVLGDAINEMDRLPADVLNKLQSIKWEINSDIKNMLEPISTGVKGVSRKVMKETSAKLYTWLEDKPFYFAWAVDYRGRLYSRGYHINVQGTEYKKAMIGHAHKEQLTPEGKYWLMIEIANCFGQDKLSFDERIKFVQDFVLTGKMKYSDASEPHLAYKAMKAYNQSAKGELVAGNTYMDATASGLQIYSALASDEISAQLCNMNNSNRADVYTLVANKMSAKLGVEFTREDVKKPVMTFFYGKMESDIVKPGINQKVLDMTFADTMLDLAPEAVRAMNSIYACRNTNLDQYSWTLPDGFKVTYKVMSKQKSTSLGIKGFVTTKIKYRNNEAYEYSRALAPNVIHSIDAYIVRELVRKCDFEVSTIHDSFSCHPNNMGVLRQVYKDVLCEINSSNMLSNIISEIAGMELVYNKANTLSNQQIQTSPYALS